MEISITTPDTTLPTDRAFAISMVIKSFKGRRDVAVHLFRSQWNPEEYDSMDWNQLLDTSMEGPTNDPEGSRRVILEAFTDAERDTIVDYLKTQYSTRLTDISSVPISFPVPIGLTGFTQVQPGKSIGFIEFSKIPSYSLGMPLMGFYDLSQHPPIADE